MAFVPDGGVVKLSQDVRLIYGEVSRKAEVKDTKKGGKLVKFSVCAGAKPDTEEKLFIDCVAFTSQLVGYCMDLTRGDPICAIGKLESREYEGKTYYDFKLIWCNSPMISAESVPIVGHTETEAQTPASGGVVFTEQEDDDAELPF